MVLTTGSISRQYCITTPMCGMLPKSVPRRPSGLPRVAYLAPDQLSGMVPLKRLLSMARYDRRVSAEGNCGRVPLRTLCCMYRAVRAVRVDHCSGACAASNKVGQAGRGFRVEVVALHVQARQGNDGGPLLWGLCRSNKVGQAGRGFQA